MYVDWEFVLGSEPGWFSWLLNTRLVMELGKLCCKIKMNGKDDGDDQKSNND